MVKSQERLPWKETQNLFWKRIRNKANWWKVFKDEVSTYEKSKMLGIKMKFFSL